MKRMSDVFDFDRGVGYPATWSDEQVISANKALRNIDALADALELLLGDKAIYELNNKSHAQAICALVDYRGEE